LVLYSSAAVHGTERTLEGEDDNGQWNMNIDKRTLDKSAEAILKRAEQLFDLAKQQHELADQQHAYASKQHENADRQKVIAADQHRGADQLEAKADKTETLGETLVSDAVGIKGETLVTPRSAEPSPPAAKQGHGEILDDKIMPATRAALLPLSRLKASQ
jgi:hypothetical protein